MNCLNESCKKSEPHERRLMRTKKKMCIAVEVVGQIMGKYISWGEGRKEKSAANANQKDKVEEVRTRCLSQYQPL